MRSSAMTRLGGSSAGVLMDWQLSQKKYSPARAGYETRILDMAGR
jgi:hypothetical protein